MVDDIKEDDFDVDKGGQVEIIGWLYQYYNTEPKDVAVASPKSHKFRAPEIASATQIFTPDWIVKYMVQNSLGKYWVQVLRARGDDRPEHQIADSYGWQYYMVDADQSDETRLEIKNLNLSLEKTKIQDIQFLDPAMGSGHILVYAYELLMDIYKSEGFSQREAALSIIQNNLYGMDIDERAFQLAYFAVMMCFRKYNRRALDQGVTTKLHFFNFVLPTTGQLDLIKNTGSINTFKVLKSVVNSFQHATETGSLTRLDQQQRTALKQVLDVLSNKEVPMYLHGLIQSLTQVQQVANILESTWDVIVTNPPYMGSARMNKYLSNYVDKTYREGKSDLFSAFMERFYNQVKPEGYCAMVTMQSWMFLKSFETLRIKFLNQHTISNLMHMENGVMGIAFGTAVTVARGKRIGDFVGTYHQIKTQDAVNKVPSALPIAGNRFNRTKQTNFEKIPGSPIAYWASQSLIHDFEIGTPMGSILEPRQGLATADNNRFLRQWYEVEPFRISFTSTSTEDALKSGAKWFPYNKGGSYRKWYGNYDYVVNWQNDGYEIKHFTFSNGKQRSVVRNPTYYFREAITWSKVTSGSFNIRFRKGGSIFDTGGNSAFADHTDTLFQVMAVANSPVGNYVFRILNPTINMLTEDFKNFPLIKIKKLDLLKTILNLSRQCTQIAKEDWDTFELSWEFKGLQLLLYIAEHQKSPPTKLLIFFEFCDKYVPIQFRGLIFYGQLSKKR
ncbi:BREX-1 system adenine-specific DNA-methyltransferase PglX [Lacticaseibacillus paracasei]|uniref:BREX-1 system adenine-specific DNA-methyltransferase PglX n=1 Tax=Lacticaseibacillus paracasei TaxID=1597 RepID=UPI0001DBDF8D|nr:BREX-1 system adenine-specific DNA-methyltransferase PglX [Lacticaseibacillus paracasei]UOG14425.1 BREX-1 system adenine-specific DNA-methyltransferase PglX [Lacticaseibacillus paracasei]